MIFKLSVAYKNVLAKTRQEILSKECWLKKTLSNIQTSDLY